MQLFQRSSAAVDLRGAQVQLFQRTSAALKGEDEDDVSSTLNYLSNVSDYRKS